MTSLANYRSMHMRMQQLAAEGALDGGEGELGNHDRAAAGARRAALCTLGAQGLGRLLQHGSCKPPAAQAQPPRPLPNHPPPCPSPTVQHTEMHAAAAGNIVAAMSDLDGFTAKLSAILQADLTHAGGPLGACPFVAASGMGGG